LFLLKGYERPVPCGDLLSYISKREAHALQRRWWANRIHVDRREVFKVLPYPVTFVYTYSQPFPELFHTAEQGIPDPDYLRSRPGSEFSWVAMTYLNLRHKNLNVSISRQLVPGKICVAVAINLRIRQCLVDSFLVGCRCDHARPTMCEMTIVQNQAHVESETDILLPHWPQPGLLARLKERGNRI
jgi:hypothetical protein